MVKPEVRRTAAAYLIASYTVAAVRACGVIGISRSAFAYRKKTREEALREQIKELAGEHYRWGYRLLFNYIRRLGETLNHKKFLRIYRQEYLQIGKRSRRKERRFDRVKSGQPKQINERWSMFMYDVLENKRSYRILNVIDDHSRECLCCEVSRSFGGYDVAEALDRLICLYGRPKAIKSDNGGEFRSRYMEKWSKERGITLEFTTPGKPKENGQIESFNGTMRNEILRGVEFESVREAREELEKWREKYNNERPHSALNYEPPSTRRSPHGGDTNRFNLESINTIDNNIDQVSLLP